MQAGQPCRNRTQNFGSEFDLIEIDHFGPERVGDRLVKLRFVHDPMIDHRLVDRFPILRRLEQDVVGLGAIHHALVNEKVGEAFVIHCKVCILASRRRSCIREEGSHSDSTCSDHFISA